MISEEQKAEIAAARAEPRPTLRAVSEGMEARLYTAHPVLDHGLVRVIDYMGNDAAIVQAARVSYGAGTKHVQNDEGLIRYLMRHWHSTPFEMCLAGDVRVPTFPCPGAKVKHYTMREIAKAFEEKGRANSWVKLLRIRTVNPETGVVAATKIKNAWRTGVKTVYEITTEEPFSRRLKVTSNHPILTPAGFRSLDDGLNVGDAVMHNGVPALHSDVVAEIMRRRAAGESLKIVSEALGVGASTVYKYTPTRVPRKSGYLRKPHGAHSDPRAIARRRFNIGSCFVETCEKQARDRHHIDGDPHHNSCENIVGLCAKHHRHAHTMGRLDVAVPARIASIRCIGEEEVFDLEVEDQNHTFVAEGIVVHNCEVKFHVKLPVFVARQWIRHRTANVNEYSARYSILDREFYIPAPEHLAAQSTVNNQGRGAVLEGEEAARVLDLLKADADRAYDNYEAMLSQDGQQGLARELARMNLPANIYTQWYWKTDLHNLFHFLRLRADPHAQYEIRAYAEIMLDIVADWVPLATAAFRDYRMGGASFSAPALDCLQRMLKGEEVTQETSGMSKREWAEFQAAVGRG